jgi:hypothetical protein
MATMTTYGIGFKGAQTSWKDSGVYFHMHQTSSPYHVGASLNHYFGAETFFANGAATHYAELVFLHLVGFVGLVVHSQVGPVLFS